MSIKMRMKDAVTIMSLQFVPKRQRTMVINQIKRRYGLSEHDIKNIVEALCSGRWR